MSSRNKYVDILETVYNYLTTKAWIPLVLILALLIFYRLLISWGILSSMGFAFFPVIALGLIILIVYSEKIFYALFASHFVFSIVSSLIDIQLGITVLIVNLLIFSLLCIHLIFKKIEWGKSKNGMLLLYLIWTIFCLGEIANPNHVQAAWNIAITQYAVYPLLCAILAPLAIKNYKGIQWLLIIWSVFIIIAAFKGYWQKNYGFTERDLIFLYEMGGARTHIIWSGIRYFSLFPDAANFGVHMGMAILGFGISSLYVKKTLLKVYFGFIVIIAIYGLLISGTRAAIAVPVAGLGAFSILSRNWKMGRIGFFTLLAVVIFFRFTSIGDGDQNIRRIRTAFRPTEDASYQVRIANREKMKLLMDNKPFGYGIGLGGKADRFKPKELMPYPPDSWLVNVWTDSGSVGLTLYLLIHGALFTWCSWILMFEIKDKRLRGLLISWLCINVGFFVSAYANDVMQYPNSIIIYTGFALCFAGPYIDKHSESKDEAI